MSLELCIETVKNSSSMVNAAFLAVREGGHNPKEHTLMLIQTTDPVGKMFLADFQKNTGFVVPEGVDFFMAAMNRFYLVDAIASFSESTAEKLRVLDELSLVVIGHDKCLAVFKMGRHYDDFLKVMAGRPGPIDVTVPSPAPDFSVN